MMTNRPAGRRSRAGQLVLWLAGVLLLIGPDSGAQSLTYRRGQNVGPAYEGWTQNPDGSFSLLFGYMNRNWEEEIEVPVGPDNTLEPGGPDQGQPTHFYPRRNRFMFKIQVPKDFGNKEVVWTLTTHGKTEKAYGNLRTDYFLDNTTIGVETGGFGGGGTTPETRKNLAPTLRVEGAKRRTVTVGQPLTLVAYAADDGIPARKPAAALSAGGGGADESRNRTVNPAPVSRWYRPANSVVPYSGTGLRLSWFVYRASGRVTFSPEQVKVWEDTRIGMNSPWSLSWMTPEVPPDGKWVAQAVFDEPGTYVLRARAHDGALGTDEDVSVTVTP